MTQIGTALPPSSTRPSPRVLVVEDEALVSLLIEQALGDIRCTIVGPAVRVEQALALAGEAPLDCALLDVNVHGELVYPVAEILSARRIPFTFVTGYDLHEIDKRFRGRPVIRKPFTEAEIQVALLAQCT
jgi:CheY-like chemotaxis protein